MIGKHKLLMVDDDAILLEFAKEFLESHGYEVDTVKSGSEAVARINSSPKSYSLVILDYQMSGQNGAETCDALVRVNPNILILIYSGESSRDEIILSTRSGARGFVDKAEGKDVLLREVRKLCETFEREFLTVGENQEGDLSSAIKTIGMVGVSKGLATVARKVSRLRNKSGPVLILGESGTGKELVARALHKEGPFVAVNCADYLMSKGTARAELFGYVKGSFTGADSDRPGVFEEAAGGTVFLDEIYSLPPEAQVGLLRTLQEKVITRVGSTREIKIRCRILTAAKPNLGADVGRNRFKADLYYRISQNIIEVPALRDRKEDISILVNYFCKKWCAENHEEKTFLAATIPFLEKYSWPGNVRELENIVYSSLNVSSSRTVSPSDLGDRFFRNSTQVENTGQGLRELLTNVEKNQIIEIASRSLSLREAASILKMSSSGLLRLFEKHGIDSKEIIGSAIKARERKQT